MPPVKCPSCGSPAPTFHPRDGRFEAPTSESPRCPDEFHNTRKRVKTVPVYYLKVPLTHLAPPEEQVGGQSSFDAKVFSILEDAIKRGFIASWVTSDEDLADFSKVVKEGGNADVEVGVFRVAERSK